MESDVWEKAITEVKDIESVKEKLPSEIIKEYCDQLKDVTEGNVLAKIGQYEHTIKQMSVAIPFGNIPSKSPKNIFNHGSNPQDYLGVVDEENRFTYEIYITGSKTQNYKYRFCFIEFGIPPYPFNIVIDNDIANELGLATMYSVESAEELKVLFIRILNSNKITEVIKSLMAVNSQMEQ